MIVPRSTWLDGSGLTWRGTGPAFRWDQVTHLIAHWPGWPRGTERTIDTDARAVDHARRIHAGSSADGYDHEYNFHIPLHGGAWEGRGFDHRDAAAGPPKSSDPLLVWPIHCVSVQFPRGYDQPLTDAQIATARWLAAHVSERAGRPVSWQVHGRIRMQTYSNLAADGRWATQCPGQTITHAVDAGLLDPIDEPVITPSTEEDGVHPTAIITVSGGSLPPGAYVLYAEYGHCRTWLPTHAAEGSLQSRAARLGRQPIPAEAVDLNTPDGLARMQSMPLHGGGRSLNGINVDDWGVPL